MIIWVPLFWITILPLRSAFGPEGNSNVDGQHPAPLGCEICKAGGSQPSKFF